MGLDPLGIGSIIGGIGSAVNAGIDVYNAVQSQRYTDYMKEQQEITRQREDTAVQRRVADLRAAGLNPVLAAGSAATTSAPINVGVPHMEPVEAFKGLAYANQLKQQAITDEQIRLIKLQEANAEMDYKNKDAQGFLDRSVAFAAANVMKNNGNSWLGDYVMKRLGLYDSETESKAREADDLVRNSNMARNSGVPTNSQYAMDEIAQAQMIANALKGKDVADFGQGISAGLKTIGRLLPLIKPK